MRSRSRFSAPLRLNSFGEERGHRTPNSAPPSSTILRCSTIASASTQPSVTSPPLRRRPTSTRRAPHESVSTEVREGQIPPPKFPPHQNLPNPHPSKKSLNPDPNHTLNSPLKRLTQ